MNLQPAQVAPSFLLLRALWTVGGEGRRFEMMDRSGSSGSEEQQSVLLVDDGSTSTAHRRRLEARGYHVTKASDPDVALTVARQAAPRIIFLTVERAGSDRSMFLQALRRDDRTRHIPVITLSDDLYDSVERLGLSRVRREHW
jgi:PleD family two-component response regulator